MKLILSLTLIWTLSSKAEALQCWDYLGVNPKRNFLFPCESTELCATFQEYMDGRANQSTTRRCFSSSLFSEGLHTFSLSLGLGTLTTSVRVCNTDGCNIEDIPYPGDLKKNGLKCFTCDDPSSVVCNKIVQCMGVQDRCIKRTVLGCVSANLCEDARRLEFFLDLKSPRKPKCCGSSFCNSAWSVKLSVMSLLLGLFTLTFY
ncbi:uncharacterized protein LOC133984397 [Scomber scombrus]|uniref:uncharacterized protein LOC133984397 n=1 Tax=Scomber scombrus TaxID=13677 RepID=UPI002DD8603C|nr:uncharacterized protein LOC133984397 [Scomber scombrus]